MWLFCVKTPKNLMFLSLVVPNCFLWYIHDTFSWVTSALCLQGLQWAEELSQPSAGWQPFFLCYPLPKWQGRAPCWGTIPEKINQTLWHCRAPQLLGTFLYTVHKVRELMRPETGGNCKSSVLEWWEKSQRLMGEPKCSYHLDIVTSLSMC